MATSNPHEAATGNEPSKPRLDDDEEDYHSSSDEDYNPDAATAEANPSESEDEDDQKAGTPSGSRSRRKKRKQGTVGDDDGGLDLKSATETVGRKSKRRKARDDSGDEEGDAAYEDDEGGEGGLIKTRAQRAKEGREKKALADASTATVDVDALWASMTTSTSTSRPSAAVSAAQNPETQSSSAAAPSTISEEAATTVPAHARTLEPATAKNKNDMGEEMITIKRTYDFAGETISEEKQVPKSSAEARLYIESQQKQQDQAGGLDPSSSNKKPGLRRPKKRISSFDPSAQAPNPKTANNASSSSASAGTGRTTAPTGVGVGQGATTKLNTIEKSKLDWAGFVDKEGIKEDLDEHSRAKEGYLDRMGFLGRVHANQEEEVRRAKKI